MRRASICWPLPLWSIAVVIAMIDPRLAWAEPHERNDDRDRHRPVYQRRAFEWKDKHDREHRRERFRTPHAIGPQVSAGWFQRPYPYHLDYYRMRYGGSYAPYFGNLYGPPQVVTAPPYYGPYYGGYQYGDPQAYSPNGEYAGFRNGTSYEVPSDASAPSDRSSTPSDESLPAP